MQNCNLRLFADDTNLFIIEKSYIDLENKANECLSRLHIWFAANKLSLNAEKTCYMLFSPHNKASNIELELLLGTQRISKVSSCKYLGIMIDDALNWKLHIDLIYNKLLKFVPIFYKVRDMLPFSCRLKLYYAFVFPHINYGIEVYANMHRTYLKRILTLNNKIIRILTYSDIFTPVAQLFKSVHSLPIPELHELRILMFIHKCVYHTGTLPDIFRNYVTHTGNVHLYGLRRCYDLVLSRMKTSLGQRSLLFKGCLLWNSLSNEIKSNSSSNTFKQRIFTLLSERNL